jgi:hypothetical protein
MIRVAYKVYQAEPMALPGLEKVTVDDPEGMSWRDAKKMLRKFYLVKAAELRGLTEKGAFPENV